MTASLLALVAIDDSAVLFTLILVFFIYMSINLLEILHRHVNEGRSRVKGPVSDAQLDFMLAILRLVEIQLPPD